MHELSIAQNIVEIIEQYVPHEQSGSVRSVRVRVGRLSGVVPESLEFSFSAIIAGTPLASAGLVIEPVPAAYRCGGCGKDSEAEDFFFACPSCGSTSTTLIAGSELQVVDIELEEVRVPSP